MADGAIGDHLAQRLPAHADPLPKPPKGRDRQVGSRAAVHLKGCARRDRPAVPWDRDALALDDGVQRRGQVGVGLARTRRPPQTSLQTR